MTPGTKRDYYEVLGVPRDASVTQIKQAYRGLAVKFHPDRNPDDPAAEERFKEASEAYAILSDADKRARYDRFGHEGISGNGFTGFDPSAFGDFADILGDLFGFGFGDIFGARRGGGRGGPRRGRDLQYTLGLTLKEAAEGRRAHDPDSPSGILRHLRRDGRRAGDLSGSLRDLSRSRPGAFQARFPLGVSDLPDLRRCRARQPASLFPVRRSGAGWKRKRI